jgi:hypothetical protein
LKNSVRRWLDWFMEEYECLTRKALASGEVLGPPDQRVPWSLLEEKGIEFKVVNTKSPGWYSALIYAWAETFPKKWCEEFDQLGHAPPPKARPVPKPKAPYYW